MCSGVYFIYPVGEEYFFPYSFIYILKSTAAGTSGSFLIYFDLTGGSKISY